MLNDNNKSTAEGGAIVSYFSSSITISNSTFQDNIGQYGGAINARFTTTKVTISNTSFYNNTAFYSGGAIFLYSSDTVCENCNFTQNYAYAYDVDAGGGGIFSLSSSVQLIGGIAHYNHALIQGGFIRANYGSSLTIENIIMTSNSASSGGAIYCSNQPTVILANATFKDGVATTGRVGGIVVSGAATKVHFYKSIFESNVALQGSSAFHIGSSANVRIEDCKIFNNINTFSTYTMYIAQSPSIFI